MSKQRTWICETCGYEHTGETPPDECPICGAGPEEFEQQEAAEPASKTWICQVCGYEHEGLEPPDECPDCGAQADEFVAEGDADSNKREPATPKRWICQVCGYEHEGPEPPDECPVCGVGPEDFELEVPAAAAPKASGATRRIVIVGAGVAGVSAAESAAQTAPGSSIQLVSAEPGLPYYRINISRVLAGEMAADALSLHPAAWYAKRGVELVDDEVEEIDREADEVRLSGGDRLPYDRLVLCTGAFAFVPPIAGHELRGVHTVRTLADARAVLAGAPAGARVTCIGGGLLGLEAAGALNGRGARVTVLEGAPTLLHRQLAPRGGELLAEQLRALGIDVRCGVKVVSITGSVRVDGVALASGERVEADLVILATGVRSDTALAHAAGLEVNRGVVVDERMCTSDPAIFAAGDAAEFEGATYGLWPPAVSQGRVAGANAAGGDAVFEGYAPSARIKVLDVKLFSVGDFAAADCTTHEIERDGTWLRITCRDGRVIGANLFGDISLAGALERAVTQATPLSELSELTEALPDLLTRCGTSD